MWVKIFTEIKKDNSSLESSRETSLHIVNRPQTTHIIVSLVEFKDMKELQQRINNIGDYENYGRCCNFEIIK